MTDRQRQVLEFIKWYVKEKGFPPTLKEISAHFGWKSHTAARDHLIALARKKKVKVHFYTSRGIQVL
ncbi:MAG: hypothetical protein GY861_15595 [bacterium]|nr:hypothetical protein [bacterium]